MTVQTKQAIQNLESIVKSADDLKTTASIRDKDGTEYQLLVTQNKYVIVGYAMEAGQQYPDLSNNSVMGKPNEDVPFLKRHYTGYAQVSPNRQVPGRKSYTFSETLICLATGLPGAELLVDTIQVKARGASVKGPELKQAAVEAWCEAFDVPVPSAKDLKAAQQNAKNATAGKKTEIEQLLVSGAAGIKEWNKKTAKSKLALDLKQLHLANGDLQSVEFSELNLSGSDFSSSNLSGAIFDRAELKNCNFNNCKMHDVQVKYGEMPGATFDHADIKGGQWRRGLKKAIMTNATFSDVDFSDSGVQGVDFTGSTFKNCNFENCDFDSETKFPDDFQYMDQLNWTGKGIDPRKVKAFNESHADEGLDFETFLERLGKGMDKDRLKKALNMLKKESFQLFSEVKDDSVTGIVKSQTDPDLVYSCCLTSAGHYSCCTQNLNVCGGLRGAICKHILVLILGLAKANEFSPDKADLWARASALNQAKLDKENATQTFLKYKGAEAGEIDWRPTETIPEDFYAF